MGVWWFPHTTLGPRTAMQSPEPESEEQQGNIEGDASIRNRIDLISVRAPHRYLLGCTDEEDALKRWRDTVEWRKMEGMDSILTSPLHEYDTLKKLFPVFLCKYCVLPNRSIINDFSSDELLAWRYRLKYTSPSFEVGYRVGIWDVIHLGAAISGNIHPFCNYSGVVRLSSSYVYLYLFIVPFIWYSIDDNYELLRHLHEHCHYYYLHFWIN